MEDYTKFYFVLFLFTRFSFLVRFYKVKFIVITALFNINSYSCFVFKKSFSLLYLLFKHLLIIFGIFLLYFTEYIYVLHFIRHIAEVIQVELHIHIVRCHLSLFNSGL